MTDQMQQGYDNKTKQHTDRMSCNSMLVEPFFCSLHSMVNSRVLVLHLCSRLFLESQ